MKALRVFLSASNLSSPTPLRRPARSLRSLYLRASSQGAVSELTSERLSALIALFGTLSGTRYELEHGAHGYHSAFAAQMNIKSWKTWWPFVVQLVRDKAYMGKSLGESDCYWLVRARLGEAGIDWVTVDAVPDGVLGRARKFFLRAHCSDSALPEHLAYIRALLLIRRPSATVEAAGWLALFLKKHPTGQLLDIFWTIVLDNSDVLSEELKERMLDAISSTRRPADSPPEWEALEHDSVVSISASDLTRRVTNALVSPIPISNIGTPAQLALQLWTIEARRMLVDPVVANLRWKNLTLLALANGHSFSLSSTSADIFRAASGHRMHAVDFNVVAVLAVLERLTSSPTIAHQMQDFVRTLWRLWSDVVEDDRAVHAALVRPILASFLRLLARSRDDLLRSRVLRLANTGFWAFDVGDDFARRQVQLLAVQYVVTSVLCGETVLEDIFGALPHYVAFPQWQGRLTGEALTILASYDAQLAWDMHRLWGRYMTIPEDVIGPFSLALVMEGRTELAAPLLSGFHFKGKSGQELLASILLHLGKQGKRYIDLDLAEIISKAILEWSSSSTLPITVRGRVSWAMLALASSGCSSAVVHIVRNVREKQPRYFRPATIILLIRALLYNRQFRAATVLIKDLESSYSTYIRKWRRILFFSLSRHGASVLAAHINSRIDERSLPIALVHGTQYGRFSAPRRAGFRIRRWLMRRTSSSEYSTAGMQHGIQALARTRGPGAAKVVHGRALRSFDMDIGLQTALGNVILHNQTLYSKHRNVRFVRNVIRVLHHLIQKRGFVPDRITTNIMVKSALRWPTVLDSTQVRVLFDHLVRTGYPIGAGAADAPLPFGTSGQLSGAMESLLPPTPRRSRLSFPRHVKPLYKSFIKAFFVRRDVVAARQVVGILQEVESMARALRRRARKADSRLWGTT
ncbi:hypothetical protein BV25DRAFT_1919176 [Artomyces pyxidatus]|uniref:Uncharacterized protein n=1 Tax=Artomyces pyxidatus TaxID=48021 RepID=A0ACB8SQG3_9AGAM|nr:hypothetical protein BV25DRAFT_1919176 [Artomyces pyxidatus]